MLFTHLNCPAFVESLEADYSCCHEERAEGDSSPYLQRDEATSQNNGGNVDVLVELTVHTRRGWDTTAQ